MMAASRPEQDQREDTVPDASASAPRSVEPASGISKQVSKRLGIGDVVAEKYVVERTLGIGGMGQVLAAKHVKLGTMVAIKVVHPELASDAQAVERFVREAQAMARLKSDHVVRVHDVGELPGGAPYMIMEYLEGKDLGALLVERGPLPVALALEYVRQACEALAEAHAAGIIHRDVKPQNLFVVRRASGAESVRVLDFGLAKAIIATPNMQQLTQMGAVMGTAQYMAPEQLRTGSPVDARTDIWGLGVTLFRLLTRQYPFPGTNPAVVAAAIVARDPVPIRSVRPEVPDAVAAIIERCLAKDPARRFQSVDELAYVIEQARMAMAPLTASQSFVLPSPLQAIPHAPASQSFVPSHSFAHPQPQPIPTPRQQPMPMPTPRAIAAPKSNTALFVSIAVLAVLLFAVGIASIVLVKRRPAPLVPAAGASTAVTSRSPR
jgi:serine/threonine protein kinase